MDSQDRKRAELSPSSVDALAPPSSTSLSAATGASPAARSLHRRSVTDVTPNAMLAGQSGPAAADTSSLSPPSLGFEQQQLSHGHAQQSTLSPPPNWSPGIAASGADLSINNMNPDPVSNAPVKHEYSRSFESFFIAQMTQPNLTSSIPTIDEPPPHTGNDNQETQRPHDAEGLGIFPTTFNGLPSHPLSDVDGHSSSISRPPTRLSGGFTGTQPLAPDVSLDGSHNMNLMVEASYPDWQGMMSQSSSAHSHHRAPSEYSDVSSVWSHANSYTTPRDVFDMPEETMFRFPGVGDTTFSDNNVDDRSISDAQGFSPVPSHFASPALDFSQPENPFFLGDQQSQSHLSTGDTFPSGAHTPLHTGSPHPINPTQPSEEPIISPPAINVEFAGPSRKSSFEPEADSNGDSLSIPQSRSSRARSHSDPFGQPKNKTLSPTTSPSPSRLSLSPASSPRSLSPTNHGHGRGRGRPRGSSASRGSRDSSASSRRPSTSSVENRNYILDLADPQRPRSTSDSRRVQKHPATFQCSICPKRFTRAYNLRSHLRTHTDDRPFECTVCGKAFARQHDRKRHEELHSGEKKFVCAGDLASGGKWGCGRRFARADALGRHLKSEVGRLCVKPLLDEEIAEEQQKRATGDTQQNGPHGGANQNGDGNLTVQTSSTPTTSNAPQRNFTALGIGEDQSLRPRASPHHARSVSQPVYSLPGLPNQGAQEAVNNPSFNTLGIPAVLFSQYPDLQNVDFDRLPETANALSAQTDAASDVSAISSAGSFFGGEDDVNYDGYLSGKSRSSIFGDSSPANAASPVDFTGIAAASSIAPVRTDADVSPSLHGTNSWGARPPPPPY